MTNDQMKANRFARWAKARKQYAAIIAALSAGKTVVVATQLKATKYTAKHAEMFVCKKDGLYVRHGKSLNFIGWSSIQVFA